MDKKEAATVQTTSTKRKNQPEHRGKVAEHREPKQKRLVKVLKKIKKEHQPTHAAGENLVRGKKKNKLHIKKYEVIDIKPTSEPP